MFSIRLPEKGACTPEKAGLFTAKTDSYTEHSPTSRIDSYTKPGTNQYLARCGVLAYPERALMKPINRRDSLKLAGSAVLVTATRCSSQRAEGEERRDRSKDGTYEVISRVEIKDGQAVVTLFTDFCLSVGDSVPLKNKDGRSRSSHRRAGTSTLAVLFSTGTVLSESVPSRRSQFRAAHIRARITYGLMPGPRRVEDRVSSRVSASPLVPTTLISETVTWLLSLSLPLPVAAGICVRNSPKNYPKRDGWPHSLALVFVPSATGRPSSGPSRNGRQDIGRKATRAVAPTPAPTAAGMPESSRVRRGLLGALAAVAGRVGWSGRRAAGVAPAVAWGVAGY